MKLFIKRNRIELIVALILMILSVMCFTLSGKTIMTIITYLLGAFFIVSGITVIVGTIKNKELSPNNFRIQIIQGSVLIVLGSSLFIFPGHLVRLIVGIIFILIPTIKIILEPEKKKVLLKEWYKYVVGLFFIISIEIVLDIIFLIIGIVLLSALIILIIFTIKEYKKDNSNSLFLKLFMKKLIEKGN